ncbi:4'-phosphopantetheinyl transferase superfamily protein [Desulfobacterales bacterium HSG16]|nr:4'-phosphopantetheinyl transferase superfamily protein [Desulfobacterales bacterium HSG16]
MIAIYHTSFDTPLPDNLWNRAVDMMPVSIASRIARYIRWQDRHSALLGKLLLRYGFADSSRPDSNHLDSNAPNPNDPDSHLASLDILERLEETSHGRPVLKEENIDFNISHSGNYVICGISNSARIGLDIEKIRQIDISDFKRYMNEDEWERIEKADAPFAGFFEYWTIKESVMKADGRGMSIPIEDIMISKDRANLYGVSWYYKALNIDTGYKCHMAADVKNPRIRIESISCSELIA